MCIIIWKYKLKPILMVEPSTAYCVLRVLQLKIQIWWFGNSSPMWVLKSSHRIRHTFKGLEWIRIDDRNMPYRNFNLKCNSFGVHLFVITICCWIQTAFEKCILFFKNWRTNYIAFSSHLAHNCKKKKLERK